MTYSYLYQLQKEALDLSSRHRTHRSILFAQCRVVVEIMVLPQDTEGGRTMNYHRYRHKSEHHLVSPRHVCNSIAANPMSRGNNGNCMQETVPQHHVALPIQFRFEVINPVSTNAGR